MVRTKCQLDQPLLRYATMPFQRLELSYNLSSIMFLALDAPLLLKFVAMANDLDLVLGIVMYEIQSLLYNCRHLSWASVVVPR
jgi:hypothetical protein